MNKIYKKALEEFKNTENLLIEVAESFYDSMTRLFGKDSIIIDKIQDDELEEDLVCVSIKSNAELVSTQYIPETMLWFCVLTVANTGVKYPNSLTNYITSSMLEGKSEARAYLDLVTNYYITVLRSSDNEN